MQFDMSIGGRKFITIFEGRLYKPKTDGWHDGI